MFTEWPLGTVAPDEPGRELEEQRFAELDEHRLILRQPIDARQHQADHKRRHGDDEAGERTRNADVEQRRPRRDARLDANERSEGAGEWKGNRQEIGTSRDHAVAETRYVVAHFMATEDQQDGEAVPEAAQIEAGIDHGARQRLLQLLRLVEQREIDLEKLVVRDARQRRGHERQRQQHDLHPQPALRRRLGFRNGLRVLIE